MANRSFLITVKFICIPTLYSPSCVERYIDCLQLLILAIVNLMFKYSCIDFFLWSYVFNLLWEITKSIHNSYAMIYNCWIIQLALKHHDKWTVCHLELLFLLALLLGVHESSHHFTFSPVFKVVCVWVFTVLTNVQWDFNALFPASNDPGWWKCALLYLSYAPYILSLYWAAFLEFSFKSSFHILQPLILMRYLLCKCFVLVCGLPFILLMLFFIYYMFLILWNFSHLFFP